jgi:hypothetical protein
LKTFLQIESTHTWLCLLQSKQESKPGKRIIRATLSKYLGQCLPRQWCQKYLLTLLMTIGLIPQAHRIYRCSTSLGSNQVSYLFPQRRCSMT